MTDGFDRWLEKLREEVVQKEYGYGECGDATRPDFWRPLYDEGLSPSQAFRRTLDAYAEARRAREETLDTGWKRVRHEEAALTTNA